MTDHPVSIIEPQINRVMDGHLATLRRPAGLLSRCIVGDRLWVREPFHFDRRYDQSAPTLAIAEGAFIHFAADLERGDISALGQRRFARTLPKASHRQHLVVTAVRTERLQDISAAEIAAEGYANERTYASAWDRNLSLQVPEVSWANNPIVTVIDFVRVPHPIPELAGAA